MKDSTTLHYALRFVSIQTFMIAPLCLLLYRMLTNLLGDLAPPDHLDHGTVPRQYLLEGLGEVVFTLNSWTRTKEVCLVN